MDQEALKTNLNGLERKIMMLLTDHKSLKDEMRSVIGEARMVLPGVQALSDSRRWLYSIINLKNLPTRAGLFILFRVGIDRDNPITNGK